MILAAESQSGTSGRGTGLHWASVWLPQQISDAGGEPPVAVSPVTGNDLLVKDALQDSVHTEETIVTDFQVFGTSESKYGPWPSPKGGSKR